MRVEKPNRVSWCYTQHLDAPPELVFPLLCPVRETEWVIDWKPKVVFSESGLAEADCVFITPGIPFNSSIMYAPILVALSASFSL